MTLTFRVRIEAVDPVGSIWAHVWDTEALAVPEAAVALCTVDCLPEGILLNARLELCHHLLTVALVDHDDICHGSLQDGNA